SSACSSTEPPTRRSPIVGEPSAPTARFPLKRRLRPMATISLPMLRPLPDGADAVALMTELQSLGARWISADGPGLSRAGGAGPSDHKALVLGGETLMVPIHTAASAASPYAIRASGQGRGVLERNGERIGD